MDLKESKKLIEELMKMNQNLENQNIALEMETKASQKIINKLKRENKLMLEYEEAIIEKDDQIRKFEKGKFIADNVIKNLQGELNLKVQALSNAEKNLEEMDHLTSQKKSLEKDMLELRNENSVKEEMLKTIKIEVDTLENELLEIKHNQADVDEKNIQTDEIHSGGVERADLLECHFCDERFHQSSYLISHKKSKHAKSMLESKVKDMETQLIYEKLQLSFKLIMLKEKESKEVGVCLCRSYCRIFHQKHNWKKNEGDLKKIHDFFNVKNLIWSILI